MEKINILFYNTMWKAPLQFKCDDLLPGYSISTDRRQLPYADVVVFHLPDLCNCMNEDKIIKQRGQMWVAWSLECEENYPWMKNKEFRDYFDLWMGYHLNDDIIYSYYQANYEKKLKETPLCIRENKVCMFISSDFNKSHRKEYLAELMKHIEIDSYGKLYNNKRLEKDEGKESLLKTISRYKFVIAFENSIAEDYVTEKFYNPLLAGTVPIYKGAPNVGDFIPGEKCFFDVNLFSTPKELAEFIKECYKDKKLYMQYHEWRKKPVLYSFKEKLEKIQTSPFARLCNKIQEIKRNKSNKNIL